MPWSCVTLPWSLSARLAFLIFILYCWFTYQIAAPPQLISSPYPPFDSVFFPPSPRKQLCNTGFLRYWRFRWYGPGYLSGPGLECNGSVIGWDIGFCCGGIHRKPPQLVFYHSTIISTTLGPVPSLSGAAVALAAFLFPLRCCHFKSLSPSCRFCHSLSYLHPCPLERNPSRQKQSRRPWHSRVAVHPLPTRPGNHFTFCHRPRLSPAPLFVNILCVCAVCCPSVFLATLAPTVTAGVFITFIVMADEIRSVGCCSPPSVLLFSHLTCEVMGWSPVGQLFRHRWVLVFCFCCFFLFFCMCRLPLTASWLRSALNLVTTNGIDVLLRCFQVGGSRRTGIHTRDTNLKFHQSHRPVTYNNWSSWSIQNLIYHLMDEPD